MRVAGLEALSHGALDLAEVGEDALAQRGYDPRRHVAHSALDGCLLLQLSDLVWHDGGHAVLAERLVGLVERDLAFARMLDDAGFEVVAHGACGHAAPERVHVHVTAQPGAPLHAGGVGST